MRKIAFLILTSLFLITSCSSFMTVRKVDNNVLYSSEGPELLVWVAPDIKYIGNSSNSDLHKSTTGNDLIETADGYIFGEKGTDSVLEKGVIIDFCRLDKGYYLPERFNKEGALISDIKKLNSQYYEHVVCIGGRVIRRDFEKFLMETGAMFPNLCIVDAYARRIGPADKKVIYIYYFEKIDMEKSEISKDAWFNMTRQTMRDQEKMEIDTFLKRSEQSIKFISGD